MLKIGITLIASWLSMIIVKFNTLPFEISKLDVESEFVVNSYLFFRISVCAVALIVKQIIMIKRVWIFFIKQNYCGMIVYPYGKSQIASIVFTENCNFYQRYY